MIGGLGSVPGNLIGATLVTVLPEFLRDFGDYYWIVFSTICLVMAILLPDGLWSLITKFWNYLKRKFGKKPEAVGQEVR